MPATDTRSAADEGVARATRDEQRGQEQAHDCRSECPARGTGSTPLKLMTSKVPGRGVSGFSREAVTGERGQESKKCEIAEDSPRREKCAECIGRDSCSPRCCR